MARQSDSVRPLARSLLAVTCGGVRLVVRIQPKYREELSVRANNNSGVQRYSATVMLRYTGKKYALY